MGLSCGASATNLGSGTAREGPPGLVHAGATRLGCPAGAPRLLQRHAAPIPPAVRIHDAASPGWPDAGRMQWGADPPDPCSQSHGRQSCPESPAPTRGGNPPPGGGDGLAWAPAGRPGLQDAPRAAAWRLRPSDLRLPGLTAGYLSGLASGRPQRQLTRAVMVSTEASVSLMSTPMGDPPGVCGVCHLLSNS